MPSPVGVEASAGTLECGSHAAAFCPGVEASAGTPSAHGGEAPVTVHPVQRVRQALAAAGLDPGLVRELPADTGTAEAAALAVDAPAGSIVKSLVFLADDAPLLVLVAGDRRADVKRMRAGLGLSKKRLRIAQPAEVFELTGFDVGGVPPLGHRRPLRTLVDRSLGRFDIVWAAAGSAHAVFPVRYAQLVDITQGEILDLAE